jgi:NADH dehydrogenase
MLNYTKTKIDDKKKEYSMHSATAAHRVVIVGGGAGGLELAAKLGRKFGPAHVVLIDRSANHIWKPSLHEVAAGTLDINREGLAYAMLAKDCGFTFLLGDVAGVDRGAREVRMAPMLEEDGSEFLPARSIPYGTLVLSVGSKANFFSTPGAEQHAIALDSTSQAEKFRLKFLRALMVADHLKSTNPGHALNIAIVGGGATGVELAAELTEAGRDMAYYGITHLDPARDVRITIIEGAPRILAMLPEKLSTAAHQLLSERGVSVKTGIRVACITPEGIVDTAGVTYPAQLCVWAAGIEAPALTRHLDLELNRMGQVVVNSALRTSDPDVFAFGDCAQAPWGEDGKFMPARAQVAHQQASFLVKTLSERLTGKPETVRSFTFHDHGSLVSVGQSTGVGSLMGVLSGKSMFVEGFFARMMYMSLHLMHHQAFMGTLRMGWLAIGRLMLRRSRPRVKLH